ncbi:MAG: hypothetical protein NC039_08725 [Muribaculaceae bacterium]|nr:hypothetical protein [Muribaculaceae bacterium]
MSAVSAVCINPSEIADSILQQHEMVVTGPNTPVRQAILPYAVSIVGNDRLESTGETQVL